MISMYQVYRPFVVFALFLLILFSQTESERVFETLEIGPEDPLTCTSRHLPEPVNAGEILHHTTFCIMYVCSLGEKPNELMLETITCGKILFDDLPAVCSKRFPYIKYPFCCLSDFACTKSK